MQFETFLLHGLGPAADTLRSKFAVICTVAAAYLAMTDGGTSFVRAILDQFPKLTDEALKVSNSDPNVDTSSSAGKSALELERRVGEWIGILERYITLTFVLTGNFAAVAFALTAKSIARFEQIEKSKAFAEYYLFGTSSSLVFALAVGMVVKLIFGF